MLEKISEILQLAYRQENAIRIVGDLFKKLFTGGFSFKGLIAVCLAFAESIGCVLFDAPLTPRGQTLDLSGYELVFEDNFDGDSLNTDYWHARGNGPRRSGFNADSQITVKDGNLVLTGEYRDENNGEYGAGWYVGMIALNEKHAQGYYEIRCKCNKGSQFWSAFWIQGDYPYDHYLSNGGIDSAEIDIFESISDKNFNSDKLANYVFTTIHCNGVDDDIKNIDSRCLGKFKSQKDIYDEYNTYGLEWTDTEYIFYINGVETARSSWGKGVCQNPEELIVSLEIPDDEIKYGKDYKTEYIVDYVRIYDKNPNAQPVEETTDKPTGFNWSKLFDTVC